VLEQQTILSLFLFFFRFLSSFALVPGLFLSIAQLTFDGRGCKSAPRVPQGHRFLGSECRSPPNAGFFHIKHQMAVFFIFACLTILLCFVILSNFFSSGQESKCKMLCFILCSFVMCVVGRTWPVYNPTPESIVCNRIKVCWNFSFDFDNVCAVACEPGSVKQEDWISSALQIQERLSFSRPICFQQWPGSHNSGISLANGYGVLDGVLSHYARSVVRTRCCLFVCPLRFLLF
jgi:hypothetical protein